MFSSNYAPSWKVTSISKNQSDMLVHTLIRFLFNAHLIGLSVVFGSINVFLGPESEKDMMTGRHVVADIYCIQCAIVIGWTYVSLSLPARLAQICSFSL